MSAKPAKPSNKYVKYTPYESFMLGEYREIDKAIKKELEKFRLEDIVPTCGEGCYFCCRQKIPLSLPEAHVLGQYIKRNFSDKQKDELRKRMSAWFDWVSHELPKYGNTAETEMEAFYDHSPYCPLLVVGKCSTYPVRPFVCRVHYVSSSLDNCRSYIAVRDAPDERTLLRAIKNASEPFAMRIRQSIAAQGVNPVETMVLLPQGLALEMGWKDLLPES